MIFKLAWRNLWRNKNRTLITVASVFFAVVLSVLITSVQRGTMENIVKDIVNFYSSYIQVHKKGYSDEKTLDNVMDANDTLLSKIRRQNGVSLVSPRLETFLLASTGEGTDGCMMVGIVPSLEGKIIQLGKKVKAGSYMADTGTGVMISEGLAHKMGLKINDTILLLGQGYQDVTAAGKYPVRAIISFGTPQLNDHLLFMPLWQAQQFLSADNKATSIVVSIDNEQLLNKVQKEIADNLSAGYEVINWQEMIPETVELVKSKEQSEFVVTLLLYILITFGMFATLLMMMNERKFELGMLLAIGMKKTQLMLMMFLESVFVSVVGCITGLAASIPLTYFMASHPIRFTGELKKMYENFGFEASINASTDPSIYYTQVLIIAIASFLLSAYPLYRIFRMNALNAMKK